MTVDLLAVLACGVLSMILGFVWYGPLFGKQWMKIIGATPPKSAAEARKMQQGMIPIYLIAFAVALLEAYALAALTGGSNLQNSFWIWLGFVVPTVVGGSMWNNDSHSVSFQRFLIQSGYYLVLLTAFSLILTNWP